MGFPSESYVWVDISEIYQPYELKNNGLEKECEDDSITYCVSSPKPFNYTFEDFKKLCDRTNYIIKLKTSDGEVYDTYKDIPSGKGSSTFEVPLPITDFNLFYELPKRKISAYIAVKNIGDIRYISTRRPEGIRVGLPRLITAGLEISL